VRQGASKKTLVGRAILSNFGNIRDYSEYHTVLLE
jgi:hypothetical protein